MKDIGSRWGPAAYDIHGDKLPSLRMSNSGQASMRRALQRRSPPEAPESYEDYRFFLTYRPREDECLLPEDDLCSQALEALVKSPCKFPWSLPNRLSSFSLFLFFSFLPRLMLLSRTSSTHG